MKHPTKHPLGLLLLVASFAAHLVLLFVYLRKPDSLAALTVWPIWFWSLLGLFVSLFTYFVFRHTLGLLLSVVWFVTALALSDETVGLARVGQPPPQPGPRQNHLGQMPIRIATLSCSPGQFERADELSRLLFEWRPDIVFLQDMPHPYVVKQLAEALYGNSGDYRYDAGHRCGTLLRGRISEARQHPEYRQQYLPVRLANGREVQLVNLHLKRATTSLELWSPQCWRDHRATRKRHREELSLVAAFLNQTQRFTKIPTIIAGNFSVPASDGAQTILTQESYVDVFEYVGTGPGNTFHQRWPLMRLSQIRVSPELIPLRSRVVDVPNNAHRLLIADVLFE